MSAAESLFVVSQSSEPYSILLVDPETGSSKWSFRGNELQSSKIHYAVFLGEDQTHLCIALADKPIIISVPMKEQKGNAFCTKSILHLNPNLLVSHPTGDFIFITAENKLFTWEILNGQMLSIVEEHARSISVLKISACGNYLVTASKDGAVKIFLTANLITPHGEFVHIQPIGGHNFHTLQINDIFISNGTNPRILSVSDDHSAILYSLATQEILLKLKTNQPLTSCCMDPAETRIFISSQTGGIRIIDIQTEFKSSYHRMKENENPAEHSGATFKGKFENHECAITNLTVNGDGTRLASGDRDGVYCIWDVSNGQCIRSGKMSGPIASLNFTQNCSLKQNEESRGVHIPLVSSLQKQISAQRRIKVNKHIEKPARNDINLRALCNSLLEKVNNGQPTKPKNGEMRDNEEASKYKKRRFLDDEPSTTTSAADAQQTEESMSLKERLANVERELERVMQINSEIYQYVAKSFVGEETN